MQRSRQSRERESPVAPMTQATVHDARPVSPEGIESGAFDVPRMSERYWGLVHPEVEHDGITATPVPFEQCLPFMTRHMGELFLTGTDRFFEEKMTPAKRRYLAESDAFLFRRDGVDVGMCVCNPSDWSTYYIRMYTLLPGARHGEFSKPFLCGLFERLRSVGVKRVEANTSPTNLAVQRALTGLGMFVTGTLNTERFGLVLQLTGFLDEAADRAFRKQFLHVPGEPAGCPAVASNKKGVVP